MYRPPVNPGFDAIGAAIATGLGDARASLRRNRNEEEERSRYRAEQERQKRLEAVAEQERQRRVAIENAEMGVVGEDQAYDPIQAAVAQVPARRPEERAQDWFGRMSAAPEQAAAPQPRRLREGVVQTGGLFIDPRAGLTYRRQQITREDERAERQRQIEENAARIRGLDPTMSPDEAIARAVGLSIADPVTRGQAVSQARENLEMSDEFRRRQESRENAEWGRRHSITESAQRAAQGGALNASRTRNSAEGLALTLADEALTRTNPRSTNIQYVRGRLREQAKAMGLNLNEGELQEIALRAVYMVQDQQRQHTYAPRDPYAQDEWDMQLGGDPIATAVVPGAQPGQQVTVRRTRTPTSAPATGSPGGRGASAPPRAVGPGIKREAKDALRAGAGETEVRNALRGRGYTDAQVNDIIAGAK